ncbi:UDP-N-acetylmuramoyl-L-alanine--D-glutamate ligase [Virgisporangium aurantiacum]|uniref:UDP-N-acetylmuramoylalanine--D-glutamate ligase n=1 Tax=Virgisporangium aurantiacum TaxID=175570 RepID=A0A8J3Z7F8_9ACTN|nr:UDP-N-acetylmuramoyl-L-alanine--D-glutamate ligase [Virgisporangium aurantiacum]GIJ58412.1 UDP-N-acetylmuramoylalanine--D-glutamate ligase [Virgisporangium aurantiacum]
MSYAGRRVLVAGARMAGAASARALLAAGAEVTVVDANAMPALEELAAAGARTVVGAGLDLLKEQQDVVVSPGFAPHHPLAAAAVQQGLDVYSEPELAWRLRGPGAPPWLAITGTNGKTTTVTMLAAMLAAGGLRTAALGNIGEPLVDAQSPEKYDVLAVELSSFQLYWSSRMAPQAGAFLNLADDHLEWHGTREHYIDAKTNVWRAARAGAGGAVGNRDDALVAALLGQIAGGIGFTTAGWDPGQFGLVDGVLVDADGNRIIEAAAIRPPGTHNVANALAAAALARWFGVPLDAVRRGLAGYVPEPHRNALVATVDGVAYVDDSKATNPHAAVGSLTAYPRVVWVAGGQLKGVDPDDLVATVADRLAGAVLLGVDRGLIRAALARHAPQVPVVEVSTTHDGAMDEVVRAAAGLAGSGDTVLLAPAAASKDMFASFEARGHAFAAAVRRLGTQETS